MFQEFRNANSCRLAKTKTDLSWAGLRFRQKPRRPDERHDHNVTTPKILKGNIALNGKVSYTKNE